MYYNSRVTYTGKINLHQIDISYIDPRILKKNPWNPNMMTPQNEEKLEKSIERLEMWKPIIVRTLGDDSLEILGGEHRTQIAVKRGIDKVPVINLGKISDEKAKEISLADNGRYGTDDALKLSELFGTLQVEQLSEFLPYSDRELEVLFDTKIDFSSLELTDDDDAPVEKPESPPVKTHQVLRFKVPVEDAHVINDLIESIMKHQGFVDSDSLTNAGDALVYVCHNYEK